MINVSPEKAKSLIKELLVISEINVFIDKGEI